MDTDNDRDVYETPEKLKERSAIQEDLEDDPIMGVIMGANDNSYLLKGGGKFDVLRNVRVQGLRSEGKGDTSRGIWVSPLPYVWESTYYIRVAMKVAFKFNCLVLHTCLVAGEGGW